MSETVSDTVTPAPEPITATDFDIKTDSGETFKFKIPSPRDYARVGAKAHALRIKDSPQTGGSEYGLDSVSSDLYRGMAILECLLIKADAKDNWPFSEDDAGRPTVNSEKFPPSSTLIIMDISKKFEARFFEFVNGGNRN